MKQVDDEILEIMQTYREQDASPRGVDTPGGLEHMGDVWSLLHKWERLIIDDRAKQHSGLTSA